MKRVIIIALLLFLYGCKSYVQVFNTKSLNVKIGTDSYYVFENDTIKITYSLWENKGLLSFTVFNKSSKPIYIDWKKCCFIDKSTKLDYWIDKELRKTVTTSSGYVYKAYLNLYNTGNHAIATTEIIKYERITFIPPRAKYHRSQFHLLPIAYYPMTKLNNYKMVSRNDKSKTKGTRVYEMNFTKAISPYFFRNFLTYSFDEDFETEFYIDNEFYISSIKEMRSKHFKGKIAKRSGDKIIFEYPFYEHSSFYLLLDPYFTRATKGYGYK